jgi:hypothetical protein
LVERASRCQGTAPATSVTALRVAPAQPRRCMAAAAAVLRRLGAQGTEARSCGRLCRSAARGRKPLFVALLSASTGPHRRRRERWVVPGAPGGARRGAARAAPLAGPRLALLGFRRPPRALPARCAVARVRALTARVACRARRRIVRRWCALFGRRNAARAPPSALLADPPPAPRAAFTGAGQAP